MTQQLARDTVIRARHKRIPSREAVSFAPTVPAPSFDFVHSLVSTTRCVRKSRYPSDLYLFLRVHGKRQCISCGATTAAT